MSDITAEQFARELMGKANQAIRDWPDRSDVAFLCWCEIKLLLIKTAVEHGIDLSRDRTADTHVASVCEHGVKEGDWCPECNRAYKAVMSDTDNAAS